MIAVRNASYCYPDEGQFALKRISLDIKEKEILGVIGRNASGKSTLARLLNGIIIPVNGQVEVDGLDSAVPENIELIRQKVALLQSEPDNQLVSNIVEEDVAFGPENLGLESNEIRKRVDTALQMVSMEDYAKYPPYLLSGGQKQRVCIAGMLAMQPKYMILDEPTTMLDPQGKKDVRRTLAKLKQEQSLSIIVISHDFDELLQTDRLVIIDQGEIILEGNSRDLLVQMDVLRSVGLKGLEITRLIEEINKSGYGIAKNILNANRLVEELCRLK
ncbi:MAG: energy-coupling factor transporter ATPase [Syntrophomonadaceae bacterium]|nr:energy-coupling factor transporter ATPase [Syntrophomonadaceae bacterium]MDD3023632.1 energy-coupling factor transporter ATPase [Syntrophomonadaceae bacterium]